LLEQICSRDSAELLFPLHFSLSLRDRRLTYAVSALERGRAKRCNERVQRECHRGNSGKNSVEDTSAHVVSFSGCEIDIREPTDVAAARMGGHYRTRLSLMT